MIFDTESRSEGIVTAADSGYFRDLQFLVRSLNAVTDSPICVIDIGLTESQRMWCLENGRILVWTPPDLYEPMQSIYSRFWWQAWIKPFYLIQAPFDRVLWIDADCVVLRPVDDALQMIRERPLLIRDGTQVRTENDAQLYRELTLPDGTQTQGINLNSGVVGLCKIRDRELLSAWAWASQWVALHPEWMPMSSWADQGLLLWATLRCRKRHLIRQDLSWNQPVFEMSGLLSQAVKNGRKLVEELRDQFPESQIVHFLGPHKLSRQLDDELAEMFVV